MTILLFDNQAQTALAAPVNNTQTTIQVAAGTGSYFTAPQSGQAINLTLVNSTNSLITEVVQCTNITGDVLTVIRGQEGTVANQWNIGDFVVNFMTAGTAAAFTQTYGLENGLYSGSFTNVTAPTGQITTAPVNPTDIVNKAYADSHNTYTAGTGLTLTGYQFSITPTGTAGTYGTASTVPVFTTNAQGQVTSVTNTLISITTSQVSGLGTIATQNSNNVSITGGTITGVSLTLDSLNNTPVGNTTASTGAFTTLSASGTFTLSNYTGYLYANGSGVATFSTTIPNTSITGLGTMSTQNANNVNITGGSISGVALTLDSLNNTPVGNTTASTGAFTTLSASSTVSGTGFSTYLASPPSIGNTTANTGAFTTLSASSTVSGTGFTTYLASPPAIGGTTAAAGTFTTLTATTSNLGTVSTGTWNATTIASNHGGTGITTTPSNGQLLIGNGSGYALSTLTAGSGISITNGAGSISISASGGGTVTSVSVVSANGFGGSVANSTTTPAITLTTSVTGLLKGNGTGVSAAVSGTDYAPATSGTSILYGNGSGGFSNVTIGTNLTFSGGTLNASGSGMVYPSAGIPLSTGSAWGTSYSTTGSGNVVLSTNATLVTPNLGTPSALTLTNATGLPNAGLINSSLTVNGTNIALGGSGTITAAAPNALTIGTGLSGTSYTGASPVTIAISNTGVSAGTYGSASVIPVVTINAQGQVTSISTASTNAPSYQGTWNASTNSPTLTSSVGTQGYYYVVSVAGTTSLNGVADWSVGDWAIFSGGVWEKIPGSNSESFTNLTTTNLAVTGLTGYMYANGSGNVTASTTIPTSALFGTISLTTQVSGILPTANGGTNLSSFTSGGAVYATSTSALTTGTLPVASGGTGVTASSGANSVVLRDANVNASANVFFNTFSNVAAAGTTTTLTASSNYNWVVTGSGGQTYQLPNATTLPIGATYTFNNNQTSGAITVNNSSSTLVVSIPSGGFTTLILLTNGSSAGTWDYHFDAPSNVSWSTNTLSWAGSYTNGTWNGNAVGATYGGTGQTSYVTGDILYASATNTLSKLSAGTNGYVLTLSGGVPTWAASTGGVTSFQTSLSGLTPNTSSTGAITLAGTLGVASGGTGATTLTGYVYGNGTGAMSASNTIPTTALSGTITNAQLANSTISGISLGGNLASLTAGTNITFSSGTTYNGSTAITINNSGVTSFSAGTTGFTPSTATSGAVTLAGTLATTNGGTGLTSFTANGVVYASSTSALATGSALTFDGTNLGIGGTGAVPLDVYANSSALNLRLRGRSADSIGQMEFWNNAGSTRYGYISSESTAITLAGISTIPLVFVTNGFEQMRLTSTGLGIGTSSPDSKLSLASAATTTTRVLNNLGATTGATYGRWSNTGSDLIWGIESSAGGTLATGSSAYAAVLYTNSAVSLQFGTAGTIKATLDTNGNLGVGNTSPGAIFGSTIVAGPSGGSGTLAVPAGYIYSNTTNDLKYAAGTTASGAHIFNSAYSAAEYARIDSSGNLLVGTTSQFSSGKLCVQVANGSTTNGISIQDNGSSGFGYIAFANGSGSTIGSIARVGTTSAVSYNTSSDQRLKENIADADSASSLVDALQVRQYDWKSDGSHQRYGFIAQELVTVAPEAVHQPADPEEMMAVDYSKLVPMLVKEIQDLRKRLAALEAK